MVSPYTASLLTRFRRNEAGNMTIMSIFFFMSILVICGVGFDLVRTEHERTSRQQALDNAVLAGASLMYEQDPTDVVNSFLNSAGYDRADSVRIIEQGGRRAVYADANEDISTMFTGLIGVNEMSADTEAAALNAVEHLEISLVLDISGSMKSNNKIDNLKIAAERFVRKVLAENPAHTTSIHLVPYAGNVNPGRWMFDRLGGRRLPPVYRTLYRTESHARTREVPMRDSSGNVMRDDDGNERMTTETYYENVQVPYQEMIHDHTLSNCVRLGPGELTDSNMPRHGLEQVPHFRFWGHRRDPRVRWGWCPQNDTSIAYAKNNPDELANIIRNMQMYDGTGTQMGMKYGLALLDPANAHHFRAMADARIIASNFGDGPNAWAREDTKKFIVLMTDGAITQQVLPNDPVDPLNTTEYLNTSDEAAGTYTFSRWQENMNSFDQLCALAKREDRGVTIFTIAFEANDWGRRHMQDCASSPAHFYEADGSDLVHVFEEIASFFKVLRLTL